MEKILLKRKLAGWIVLYYIAGISPLYEKDCQDIHVHDGYSKEGSNLSY